MVGEVCEELHCSDRLRKKESPLPLPPPEYDLDLEQIESQCVAQCEGGKIDTFSMTRGDDLSGDSTYAQSLACHDGFLDNAFRLPGTTFQPCTCRFKSGNMGEGEATHPAITPKRLGKADRLSGPLCLCTEV